LLQQKHLFISNFCTSENLHTIKPAHVVTSINQHTIKPADVVTSINLHTIKPADVVTSIKQSPISCPVVENFI
jgi:hypothetical protein